MPIYPDVELTNSSTGVRMRLGAVVRDRAGQKWGITARHALAGSDLTRLCLQDGSIVSEFREGDLASAFDASEIEYYIAKFPISDDALTADSIRADAVWPRDISKAGSLLGLRVSSVSSPRKVIGSIIETNTIARIQFPRGGDHILLKGGILLSLDMKRLVHAGMAGTLILSVIGEAIGLAIAAQKVDDGFDLVVCPLSRMFEREELRLWAPPGSHWSDLQYRAANFFDRVKRDLGPELGQLPRLPNYGALDMEAPDA